MVFPKCAGYLTLTNKRLLFHGVGEQGAASRLADYGLEFLGLKPKRKKGSTAAESRIVHEIDIQTISGVTSYYGTKIELIVLALGLLAVIVGLIMLGSSPPSRHMLFIPWLALSFGVIALGVWIAYKSRKKVFFLNILSSASESAFSIGAGVGNFGGIKPIMALVGAPTNETDMMMKELGAIISDIRELGDRAADLWGKKSFRI